MITFQLGYLRKAERYLTQLLEGDCGDETAEDIYEALVMGYLREFRVREAATCLDHWVMWRPESVRARIWRAQYYESMMDHGKVQAELRQALLIQPGRIHERLWLAQSLMNQNQLEAALAECEISRRQAPKDPRVSLMSGLCHHKQGRHDEARREMESAVAQGVDGRGRIQALVILGQIAAGAQEFELAARHYEEAVQLAPHDSAAQYGLGTTLAKLGQTAAAQRHLQRSRTLENQTARLTEIDSALINAVENVELRLEAAQILLDQARRPEAAQWMLSALRYDPSLRQAHEFLAEFYDEQNEVELAASHRNALRGGKITQAGAHVRSP